MGETLRLSYEVAGGEELPTAGYRAVCQSRPGGVPCGWRGPVHGSDGLIDAANDALGHFEQTTEEYEGGGTSHHSAQAVRLV